MRRWTLLILGLVLIGALGVSAGLAQNGGPFGVPWFTVDGGGGTSSGGGYSLSGTLGQPDAQVVNGGPFSLAGGFWSAMESDLSGGTIYLPIIVKSP